MSEQPRPTLPNHQQSPPLLREVLIVEDTEMVRNLLEAFLKSQGFRVRVSENGREAVRAYEQNIDTIAVVLLDVQMPEMDGAETITELRKINPDVTVFFMSGDTGKYSVQDLIDLGGKKFFRKPLPLFELVDSLRVAILGIGK